MIFPCALVLRLVRIHFVAVFVSRVLSIFTAARETQGIDTIALGAYSSAKSSREFSKIPVIDLEQERQCAFAFGRIYDQ